METLIPEILAPLGIPGGFAVLLYLILKRETEHRKEERDLQINIIKEQITDFDNRLTRHMSRHAEYEKGVCGKIDKLYERLNPICDAVNKIQGYMEAQNAKGK